VTGAAPQKASFTLMAQEGSGSPVAVTPEAIQFDRPDLATVADGLPVVATAPSSPALYAGTGTLSTPARVPCTPSIEERPQRRRSPSRFTSPTSDRG
jgi:hypothetical protein